MKVKNPLFYMLSSDTKCKNNKAPLCSSPKVTSCGLLFLCLCTHVFVWSALWFSPPSFFLARVSAVMSRDAPIVCRKSAPGEAQGTGRYLTASLFSLMRAANQASGRNSDEENIWSPVAPRHASMFFKPLRISALLCSQQREREGLWL